MSEKKEFVRKRNTGIIFVVENPETENHPAFKGDADIDGKQYWVSGWEKATAKGGAVSLAFKLKEPRGDTGGGPGNMQRASTIVSRVLAKQGVGGTGGGEGGSGPVPF